LEKAKVPQDPDLKLQKPDFPKFYQCQEEVSFWKLTHNKIKNTETPAEVRRERNARNG
jgi:hypothetical protein